MADPQTVVQEVISNLIEAEYNDNKHPIVANAIRKLQILRDDLNNSEDRPR